MPRIRLLHTLRHLYLLLLVMAGTGLSAQRLQTMRAVYVHEGKSASEPVITYFAFPNINYLPLFQDKKLRRDIENARANNDPRELERLLTIYVRQFGILNFKQEYDLDFIWELAQLIEARGDTTRALFFYNIALKNQSRWVDSVQVRVGGLTEGKAVQWVDLDHYYSIVEARQQIDTLKPPKGVHINIGKAINSPAPDYAPFVYATGNVLLFSSRRGGFEQTAPDFIQNEDIYYSQISPFGDGTWEQAERLPDIINSPFNEGSACLDPDALKIYFSRCNAPDGMGVCDLYEARWDVEKGQWVDVQNLGPEVNSTAWDSHPFVAHDNETLFFCSNRDGGFGGIDLYMCRRTERGTWGPAMNLGPVINTLYNEVSPFLHPVNNTLYFSSTGHLHNLGGFDIFKSRWAYGHWEEPRNLGPLVNSKRDEYYFTIDGKGENLFFAHEQPNNPRNFDIFTYPMPLEARPDAVVKFGGYLLDSLTGYPLTGIVAAIDLDKGVEITPVYINPTGYFEFQLINNRRYLLAVIGESFLTIGDDFELHLDSLFQIMVHSALDERSLVFQEVQFERNSAEVRPGTLSLLEGISSFLRRYPFCSLRIRGHTDNQGDPSYNLELSKRRAENIREYILAHSGAPDSLITATGYGELHPVYPNDTEEHRRKNRRVEFEVIVPPGYRSLLLAEAGDDYIAETPPSIPPTDAETTATEAPPTDTPDTTPIPTSPTDVVTSAEDTPPATPEDTTPATEEEPDRTDEEDPFSEDFFEDWGDMDFDEDLTFLEEEFADDDLVDVESIAIDVLEDEEDDLRLDGSEEGDEKDPGKDKPADGKATDKDAKKPVTKPAGADSSATKKPKDGS